MNYRHIVLVSSIVACAGFVPTIVASHTGAAPVPMPGMVQTSGVMQVPQVQEKFKVIIQKGAEGLANNNFKFFYVFCKVKSLTDNVYSNLIVNAKTISATSKGPKTLSTGFSKLVDGSALSRLIGPSPATPVNETEYIRLLVSKDWKALTAKRKVAATDEQDKLVLASQPIKRYMPDLCVPLSAGMVGSIIGRVVFTVDEDATTPSGLKVTFEDKRTCRKSRISNVAKAKAATDSAYSRAKTKAKELGKTAKAKASSAWDSTKKAASSAKTKVSSAASRAKTSVTKRFSK